MCGAASHLVAVPHSTGLSAGLNMVHRTSLLTPVSDRPGDAAIVVDYHDIYRMVVLGLMAIFSLHFRGFYHSDSTPDSR